MNCDNQECIFYCKAFGKCLAEVCSQKLSQQVKVTFIWENDAGDRRSASIKLDKDSETFKKLKKDWEDGGNVNLEDMMEFDNQIRFYGEKGTYFDPDQTRILKFFLSQSDNYNLRIEIDE